MASFTFNFAYDEPCDAEISSYEDTEKKNRDSKLIDSYGTESNTLLDVEELKVHQYDVAFWKKCIFEWKSNPDHISVCSQLIIHNCMRICSLDMVRNFHKLVYEKRSDDIGINKPQLSYLDGNNSDLQKGIYEGGFKVWECTYDLIQNLDDLCNLKQKQVLDLGCGSGLLGAFSVLAGARKTFFQDYNSEVIDTFTIPNLILNLKPEFINQNKEGLANESCLDADLIQEKVAFLSGDWKSTQDYFTQQSLTFDIILSSETIYDVSNYSKLLSLLKSCLANNGIALFAAKTYYFGVGGSTKHFVDYIEAHSEFSCKQVWKTTDGVSREILMVVHK